MLHHEAEFFILIVKVVFGKLDGEFWVYFLVPFGLICDVVDEFLVHVFDVDLFHHNWIADFVNCSVDLSTWASTEEDLVRIRCFNLFKEILHFVLINCDPLHDGLINWDHLHVVTAEVFPILLTNIR
jgi:hypothetical protein